MTPSSIRYIVSQLRGLLSVRDEVAALTGEISNVAPTLRADVVRLEATLKQDFNALENSLASALQRFEALPTPVASPVMSIETALMSAGLAARAQRLRTVETLQASNYHPARQPDYATSLAQLEALDPSLFPIWNELFQNGSRSYLEERLQSCSHRTHYYAKLFGAYLEIYGHGRILDIGCGPHGLPSYLAGRNKESISGLEPLSPVANPEFECIRGFNEFLPWPDQSFHTVVSGTSLDHVLSLKHSLAEVRRVLTRGGRYVVWLASIPGSRAFDPTSPDFRPIDQFHLFHFDRVWIEPLFEEYFQIEDITVVPQPGFDHVFYSMQPL